MADIREVARNVYKTIDNVEIHVLGEDWDADDIKGLVQFDVLRVVSILYALSDDKEREGLIVRVHDLFELDHSKKIIESILEDLKIKHFLSDFYRKLPFSVGLLYEYDQKKADSNLSFTFLEMLQVLTLSIYCPESSMAVNAKTYFLSSYIESIKNHLIASEIDETKALENNLPCFDDIKLLFNEKVNDYIEIEDAENGKLVHEEVIKLILDKSIEKAVDRSKTTRIDDTFSKKKYSEVAEEMQGMELKILITDAILSNLHISFSGNVDTEELDDEEDLDGDDEYETLYGEHIDVDALWEKLYENEDLVNDTFGEDCYLVINNSDTDEDRYFKHGSMLYCLEMAREYKSELGEDDWFFIKYGENDWQITDTFYSFADGISIISKMVGNIPKPMDKGIIPETYEEFNERNIDDSNYEKLWNALQKIEVKYKKGINYEDRYSITDWESELCYEQGKFLENVEWTGGIINVVPEITIPYCTYSKMEYQQLRYYLYWRTRFRKGENIDAGYRTVYYLCAYELIAEFGPFTSNERLSQLERLYKNFKSSLSHAHWIGEYADIHGLEVQDEIVKGWAYWGSNRSYTNDSVYEVIHGNYDGVFDIMYSKSAWKFKTNTFIKKAECLENIEEAVKLMMPELDKLFSSAGIVFTDFLVGKMKKTKYYSRPYSGSIWNDCVINKLGIRGVESEGYEMAYPSGKIYITDQEGSL